MLEKIEHEWWEGTGSPRVCCHYCKRELFLKHKAPVCTWHTVPKAAGEQPEEHNTCHVRNNWEGVEVSHHDVGQGGDEMEPGGDDEDDRHAERMGMGEDPEDI